MEQQDASREDALEARLRNNQDAIDLAEIFLGEAVKLFHMKSRGWEGGVRERIELVELELVNNFIQEEHEELDLEGGLGEMKENVAE